MAGTASQFDLIIAGGGAAGLSLALATAGLGLRIAIVEAREYESLEPHPGFDARALALAKYSQQTLDSWGLNIGGIGEPIKQIKVTDQGYVGQCQMHHHEYQLDALGYVVEMARLGWQLRERLDSVEITWFCPDSVVELSYRQDAVTASLQSGQQIEARLLVVAEGPLGTTAKLAGAEFQHEDYQQTAIITNVQLTHAHQGVAYERFTEHGPLALLPMTKQRMSLVWTADPEHAAALMELSDADFIAQLQDACGYAPGLINQVGQKYSYPLALVTAEQHVLHRTVLIGNSAHTLHPIAGQGFNLALRDVAVLAGMLATASEQLGSYRWLRQYHQARQVDHQRVIQFTDGLVRVFSNRNPLLVCGRNFGLSLMAALPGVKHRLATQAMGLFGQADNGSQ